MPAKWKTVRVFISSTFRDMHAERDHLVKVTFPRLRQWCEERRLFLDDIDLRWGLTEDQVRSGKVIELCLQEIDGCRPFFICLLGSRYGETPDQLPAEKARTLRGFEVATDKSVTHLEIEYAALFACREPKTIPCEYAFFYFRDPKSIPSTESLVGYTQEQRKKHEETFFTNEPNRGTMHAGLKETIRRFFEPSAQTFEYCGVWDPDADNPEDDTLKGRLTALDMFGNRVEADLKKAIEDRFRKHLSDLDPQDPLSEERSFHDRFIQNRMRGFETNSCVYVPLPAIENAITSYVCGDATLPFVLTGPPGRGKSAALAYWKKKHEESKDFFVLARFIGASPSSTNLHRLLTNLCEELKQRFGLGENVPLDPRELRKKWPEFLKKAGACGRVVILLDAINQLDRSADPKDADWLQRPLPPGIRLIVSVLQEDGPAGSAASGAPRERNPWSSTLRQMGCEPTMVPELPEHDQVEIVKRVPSLRAKTLSNEQIRLLLSKPGARNPLFLLVVLEELRTFGAYEKLNAAIDGLPNPPETEGGIQAAVEQMFDRVLARLERDTNRIVPGLAREIFSLLATAREGLSEEELRTLLHDKLPHISEQSREREFQGVLRQVRPYLLRKGSQRGALVDFFHRSFWKAARSRYLYNDTARHQSHSDLARSFEKQSNEIDAAPNERKAVELVWNCLRVLETAAAGVVPPLQTAWKPLEQLLRDQSFLEAKCKAGLAYELVEEYHEAYQLLGEVRHEFAPRAMQGLLNLLLNHYDRNEPALNLVALQSSFAYRTDDRDKEFYKALLQLANSPDWLEQVSDPVAGEKLASEAAVDYCGLLRREGNVEEAEKRLPPLLRRMGEVGHLMALSKGEYEFAYIYFMRDDLEEAVHIFKRSADHAFDAKPPHTVGGWVSRCLQFRASYLARRTNAEDFRTLLQQAGLEFEKHPDLDFARRWVMNYKSHLFEIAFAEEDKTLAHELLEHIERSRWMQVRSDEERRFRMLRYQARQAMLKSDWEAAAHCFAAFLDVDNPVKKAEPEGLARDFLDYGIALAECQQPESARQVWHRGLDCPDKLANKTWRAPIREAQTILQAHGRCWNHLPRPLVR